MPSLIVTFRDRSSVRFTGSTRKIEEFASRIRAAMMRSVDSVISHDFDAEPRDFLCSDVAYIHTDDD
jgi:hypothetical protein